jgi:hypothetical protein
VERQVLAEHGGGCHQRFGATLQWLDGLGGLLQIAGLSASGQSLGERRWMPETALPQPRHVQAWDGSNAEKSVPRPLMTAADLGSRLDRSAVFVAHSRALPEGAAPLLAGRNVWTSGSASWFALAAQGVWVQGCAEGLGADTAASMISEPVLRLPAPARWAVLTHQGAEDSWLQGRWSGAQVFGTYATSESDLPDAANLSLATHVYWHSVAQFERGKLAAAGHAHHASGPGKTAEHIRRAGVRNFQAFPSVMEWRRWTAQGR